MMTFKLETSRKNWQEALMFSMICLAVFASFAPVFSKEKNKEISGSDLFKQYCSSCHVGGGNAANPTKPIAGSKMLRSIALFQKYLEDPPGHMPYYQSVASNKETVRKLFDYCRKLKKGQEG